jgi:glycosyltransferase involved in cell wall biosynthesis
MRIGLVTTSFPRHATDPAGRFVGELAWWLAGRLGGPGEGSAPPAIEVIAPAHGPARGEAADPGVAVRRLRYSAAPRLFYGAGAPDNLASDARARAQVPAFLLRLLVECRHRSRRWDAALSQWLLPSGVAVAITARGLPHLAVAHSSDVHLLGRLPGPAAALALALLARGPRTALVLTSESLRPTLRAAARGDRVARLVEGAEVIRMGVPAATLRGAQRGERERVRAGHRLDGEFVVLFVGRLVPVKGVATLIEACSRLPAAHLVVAGEGPERAGLERLARDRLGPRADFLGEVDPAARASWLAAADAFVLPSRVLPDGRTESAPVVLLEAMASRTPVVATRVGGNAELIEGGENGLLVPPDDPAALAAALAALAGDPALARGLAEAGRATAELHAWDRVGPRFLSLLQGLLRQRAQQP